MEMNQYLDIFIEESREHLQNMNESLLSLEKTPDDIELLNEIFRVAHTIKGMASTMGFTKMAKLTHDMENLLQEIRSGKIQVSTEMIDVLFECFDALEEYTESVGANGEEGDVDSSHLVETLNNIINESLGIQSDEPKKEVQEVNEVDSYVSNIISKAKENGLFPYNIKIELNPNCMLKAARAFIIFRSLEAHSEIIQSNPPVEDIEDEKFDTSFTLLIVSKDDKDEIREELESISEVENVEIEEVSDENVEVVAETISSNDEIEETKEVAEKKMVKVEKDPIEKVSAEEKKKPAKQQQAAANRAGKTVRVDINRLDNLMNLVSELIIIKTRMEDIGNSAEKQNMNETIEYLERITTSLHDAVMKVRMVPIERTFNRFPRMVRDLAKDLGKEISLEMLGEETEVDRTVIDEIGDPLIHLIRNSIDHGIEKTEIRKQNGKPIKGTVRLHAYPDGNNVVIEVRDDGAGINIEKVREKAISRNIITPEKAKQLSKDEVAELLFQPGFSTAEEITDLSGRGVGLDVVKSKIESIGGIVEVETNPGKGTKFIIRIPLTLAIIQALLIKIKEEIYAIPLSSIKIIHRISKGDISKVQNQEVILYRNKTLPVIRLSEVLGVEDVEEGEELITVIVKKGEKEAGLIIDSLIGQQEIVIKNLGKFLSGIKHVAGATILGNGEISLILDVNSLF